MRLVLLGHGCRIDSRQTLLLANVEGTYESSIHELGWAARAMKAIYVRVPGGPEALEVVTLPTPQPGPGEVRVRAGAIGVGRPDVLIRTGAYKWMPPLPVIPGSEMAGVVDAIGPDVERLKVGQRVLISARELKQRANCYAEYIVVPEDAPFLLPPQIAPVDALSLPNLQLANALLEEVPSHAKMMLLPGAAGGVASMLTQLAHSRGIEVIGTASSPEKRSFASANGVSAFVDPGPSMPEQVRDLTGGSGVDLAFDHLGADSIVQCLRSLAPLGLLVSYNVIKGPPARDMFEEMRSLLGRSLTLRTFSMHTFDQVAETRRALMHKAIEQLASARVKAPSPQIFGFHEIQRAHELLDAGAGIGKMVVIPDA